MKLVNYVTVTSALHLCAVRAFHVAHNDVTRRITASTSTATARSPFTRSQTCGLDTAGTALIHAGQRHRQLHSPCTRSTQLRMVRNIDLVEALVFYGEDSIFVSSSQAEFLDGVEYLVDECQRDATKIIFITDHIQDNSSNEDDDNDLYNEQRTMISDAGMTIRIAEQPAPNPRDLLEALSSITVQPKGFGGSSGFGTKAADPERPPEPKHTVVLCSTTDQCRAARFVGTRVLCLQDNDFADGIVDIDWSSICMDDIATPGSFWLNPPHPRDDESNRVDPEAVATAFEGQATQGGGADAASSTATDDQTAVAVEEDLNDDDLLAILADMDSL